MKLSVVIITKNEAANIARCLRSVAFADEKIVVDAESTDTTVDIARREGAIIHVRPWQGYGPQKNFGAQQARGEWILFIDADEEVGPALKDEIIRTINQPQVDFYWLKIVTVFLGRPLLHVYGHNPRLFKNTAGRWTSAPVHEQVERVSSSIEQTVVVRLDDRFSRVLTHPLWHYSHVTIASYLDSMHRYTTLDAEQMHKTGHHRSGRAIAPSFFLPLHLGARQCIKLLFYRRGILDGVAGMTWCFLSGYYEWEMARKYLRLVAR